MSIQTRTGPSLVARLPQAGKVCAAPAVLPGMMKSMARRLLFAVLAIPLMAGGSLAAHVVGYRLAVPDGAERARLLARTGHAYLDSGPLLVGVLTAFAVIGFLLQLVDSTRGKPSRRLCSAAFFLLPPLAFAVQEHVERIVHTGHFPLGAALEPTFLLGLALQLPFGLLALALYRALTRAATVLGRALRAESAPYVRRISLSLRPPAGAAPPSRRPIAYSLAERGPPQLLPPL
jgi:hypothetical protein